MNINKAVKSLVLYAEKEGLIEKEDEIFSINRILEALGLDSFEDCGVYDNKDLEALLAEILDFACENGPCETSTVYRDLFDTKIMGLLVNRPSEIIKRFYEEYEKSPKAATEYFYHLSRKSDYIREYRIKNDVKCVTHNDYGYIDIKINL